MKKSFLKVLGSATLNAQKTVITIWFLTELMVFFGLFWNIDNRNEIQFLVPRKKIFEFYWNTYMRKFYGLLTAMFSAKKKPLWVIFHIGSDTLRGFDFWKWDSITSKTLFLERIYFLNNNRKKWHLRDILHRAGCSAGKEIFLEKKKPLCAC